MQSSQILSVSFIYLGFIYRIPLSLWIQTFRQNVDYFPLSGWLASSLRLGTRADHVLLCLQNWVVRAKSREQALLIPSVRAFPHPPFLHSKIPSQSKTISTKLTRYFFHQILNIAHKIMTIACRSWWGNTVWWDDTCYPAILLGTHERAVNKNKKIEIFAAFKQGFFIRV